MMLKQLLQQVKRVPVLRELYYSRPGQYVIEGSRWHLSRSRADKANWNQRTNALLASEDNAFIPRVQEAGRIVGGCLIMHNGLRVRPDSYYNYAVLRMIQRNRGVHEPQEERAFREVLAHVQPGATMVELGAYWGFYSMWFCKSVPNARCILVEPDGDNLLAGRENFRLNALEGTFVQALVDERPRDSGDDGVRVVSVDALIEDQQLEFVHVLHSDIQGNEFRMLQGSAKAFANERIGLVFVSTHSNQLHQDCLEWIGDHGYLIVAEHDWDQSYSGDGLIVARNPRCPGPVSVPVSKRIASK